MMVTNTMKYEVTGLGHTRDESRATILNIRGLNLGHHLSVVFGVARTPTHHRREVTTVYGINNYEHRGTGFISSDDESQLVIVPFNQRLSLIHI